MARKKTRNTPVGESFAVTAKVAELIMKRVKDEGEEFLEENNLDFEPIRDTLKRVITSAHERTDDYIATIYDHLGDTGDSISEFFANTSWRSSRSKRSTKK